MGQIKVEYNAGGIEGLCVIYPQIHIDPRGYFAEIYNARDMKEAGFDYHFVQDNQSGSVHGVLRGLHYQISYPQTKLIHVIKGRIFDVAVDLRKDSITYGKYHGELLSDDNKKQLLIPKGFAHGFLVLSDIAEIHYKCDDFYHPDDEGGIAWNDPAMGIRWPDVEGCYNGNADSAGYHLSDGTPLIISEKDKKWLRLKDTF